MSRSHCRRIGWSRRIALCSIVTAAGISQSAQAGDYLLAARSSHRAILVAPAATIRPSGEAVPPTESAFGHRARSSPPHSSGAMPAWRTPYQEPG